MHRQKIQAKEREDDETTSKSLNMSTESLNLSKSLNMSTESEISNVESPPSSVTSSGVSPQEKRFRESPPLPPNQ